MIKLSTLKRNPDNPRIIKDQDYKDLVASIKGFPKMMNLRPIVIDEDRMIYAGDKRYLALIELGYKEVPNGWVKTAADFTKEELDEFLIKDNTHAGGWDWEALGNSWDDKPLDSWGLKTGFRPDTNPGENSKMVTDEDFAEQEGIAKKNLTSIDVVCPHCGKPFTID